MTYLTPGLRFLGSRLLALTSLSALVVCLRSTLNAHLGTSIPGWTCIPAILIGLPLGFAVRIRLGEMHHRRRAAALGARIVPLVPTRLPAGLDILTTLFKEAQEGYPGEQMLREDAVPEKNTNLILLRSAPLAELQAGWLETLGSTFCLRVFWEDLVMTAEPDNIKVCSQICRVFHSLTDFYRRSLHPILQIMKKVSASHNDVPNTRLLVSIQVTSCDTLCIMSSALVFSTRMVSDKIWSMEPL